MTRRLIVSAVVVTVAALPFLTPRQERSAASVEVARGPLAVWSDYQGRLESSEVVFIVSRLEGDAILVELTPEGMQVTEGDLLARFDTSELERELLELGQQLAMAESDLDGLTRGSQPLELRDLQLETLEAGSDLRAELQYLEVISGLSGENLISEKEIEQQRQRVEEVETALESKEIKQRLTREVLHPAAIKRARAALAVVRSKFELARKQIAASEIRAPRDGVVVYKPLHFGTEFRNMRVGDTLYPNMPFMTLPDLARLEVECYVPENELPLVQPGFDVFVHPLAYPDVRLAGNVTSVGAVAQSAPGAPQWQQYFTATVSLDAGDARLRPGMSTTVHVLSYHNPEAILVPRAAVVWAAGAPTARVRRLGRVEQRDLALGHANASHHEVVDGLAPGDVVLIP